MSRLWNAIILVNLILSLVLCVTWFAMPAADTDPPPGNMPTTDPPSPWIKADLPLGDVAVPVEFQRFTHLTFKAPITGRVTGPAATPVATVLSSLYCQAQGGPKEQWISHFLDSPAAREDLVVNPSDEQWQARCELAKEVGVSILGLIRYDNYTIVPIKYTWPQKEIAWPPDETFGGFPTVERDGKHYMDIDAYRKLAPLLKWLSENEYSMLTKNGE